jgi:hypothetical protein
LFFISFKLSKHETENKDFFLKNFLLDTKKTLEKA